MAGAGRAQGRVTVGGIKTLARGTQTDNFVEVTSEQGYMSCTDLRHVDSDSDQYTQSIHAGRSEHHQKPGREDGIKKILHEVAPRTRLGK